MLMCSFNSTLMSTQTYMDLNSPPPHPCAKTVPKCDLCEGKVKKSWRDKVEDQVNCVSIGGGGGGEGEEGRRHAPP